MEVFVEIHENVRGEDVFVIQSTSFPANDNLMELLITLDALRRARPGGSPRSSPISATPAGPENRRRARRFQRQAGGQPDHRGRRQPGADDGPARRQIQGFFDIPVDNLYAAPLFSRDIQERYEGRDLMIVSPDVGGVVRARAIATRLNCDLAIIDKRRERAGHSEVMNVIGDVRAATAS
jgi:ribose-phosphate pyrophosphokinase